MTWGPRNAEDAREAEKRALRKSAIEPWREEVEKLKVRIAKQDRIIALFKKHLKKHGNDDLVLDLLEALTEEDTAIRLFGKPEVHGERRLGVALALGESLEEARKKATEAAAKVQVKL